jgi:hypothetical protein
MLKLISGRWYERPTLPSICVFSIPKSGTVFTRQTLARGLDMGQATVTAGCFPRFCLDIEKLARFSRGGQVAGTHAHASPENLQTIAAFADRWVVHIRDPRSVVLSWVHHQNRLYAERDGSPYQLLYSYPAPSDAYFRSSLSGQIDWTIENFLATAVAWIAAWLDIIDSGRYRILLTTFADIVADEQRYIGRILDFYGIPRHRFRAPDIARTIAGSHFRVGREDEWAEVFSPAQIERSTAMIGDELLHRFGWPEARPRASRFDHRFASAAD